MDLLDRFISQRPLNTPSTSSNVSMMPAEIHTILLVSNLHCPACNRAIAEFLWRLEPAPYSVSSSVVNKIVTVSHGPDLLPKDIVRALLEESFDVARIIVVDGAREVDPKSILRVQEVEPGFPEGKRWLEDAQRLMVERSTQGATSHSSGAKHLQYCDLCRKNAPTPQPAKVATPVEQERDITEATENREVENSNHLTIDLQPARIEIEAPSEDRLELKKETIVTEKAADEDHSVSSGPTMYEALISIGGMTCSVCTGKVDETIRGIGPWVKEVSVNLMNNSGLVTFESSDDGKKEAEKIVDEIENVGYDAALDRLTCLAPPESTDSLKNGQRTISLKIKGLTSNGCPRKVVLGLETSFQDAIEIEGEPTLDSPIITITYTPRLPDMTVRRIAKVISEIDEAFEATVYHPPTIEQRSQEIQRKERNDYLVRLALCVVIAIPTFLIGVVWMALVPTTDAVRIFLETPVWAGNVTRIEWALLILSTPIMFYSANPFHTRAIKEIMAMWRRGSPVPIARRFYRFGSMNLLISLGVTVSYLSSVAMLIMAARRKPHHEGMMKGHTTTYFDSTVFLTMFLLMGRYLEAYSKAKTANGVSLLAGLRPKEAVLLEPVSDDANVKDLEGSLKTSPMEEKSLSPEYDDQRRYRTRRVPVDFLEVGDVVTVAQGSSPPLDGTIISGTSSFDESSLTGESKPAPKTVDDEVFAGTINLGQVINARIDKVAGESLIDRIVEVVREGQNRHAPIERIADKVTGYFVPMICFLAVTTWIIWLSLGVSGSLPSDYLDLNEGGWYLWSLSFAIAVFVVACPCGIGLAAPCALHVGTGLATKHAILAKGGGEAFQETSKLDCVIFDKTGTLTQGVEPIITDEEILFSDEKAQRIIMLAIRLLEETSSHPLARALVNYCGERPSASGRYLASEEVAGKGSKGSIEVDGVTYEAIIGNERFMNDHEVVITDENKNTLHSWKQLGKSVILAAIKSDGSESISEKYTLAAMFATTDPIREEARFVVSGLQKSGIDVWMITGDNPTTAAAVAAQIGIPTTRVIAGLLPTEKAEKVESLQQTAIVREAYKRRIFHRRKNVNRRAIVAMVGDGINDAPALAVADVGIAIGSGSDIAQQSSKFILVSSDLTSLLTLTDLSRAVVRRVKFNFLWACIFNIIAIPLAAGIFFPFTPQRVRLAPVWAALAMALSSVSVICCSLLLKTRVWGVGFRPRKMR